MTKGLEISALSKMIELETNGFNGLSTAKQLEDKEKENTKLKNTMKLLEKSNIVNEKKATDLALELENLKKKLEENDSHLKAKNEEAAKLKDEAQHFSSEIENLKNTNDNLTFEPSSLKSSILEQLEAGFERKKPNHFPQP
ncbi:tropomyosin-like [Lotus japonicus]|uniref:tropomyosin-like n=1 Tax=Lotus japonicus TaxID=34305 RepID=UPI0025867BE8|nr:tropomyosin-like [Lotus japonicus]